jgi:hypothetical protein
MVVECLALRGVAGKKSDAFLGHMGNWEIVLLLAGDP